MKNQLNIKVLKGSEKHPFIHELAKLRIAIFKDYPYLYDGNLEYEKKHLESYAKCPDSIIVVVTDNDTVVGASTGIPLKSENIEIKNPFIKNNININNIFYFGESILLKKYRGRKIYRIFFKAREAEARKQGYKTTTFCSVERATNDPKKPIDYKSLEEVWKKYGYQHHPELHTLFSWKEVDEEQESSKPMTFWMKVL